MIRIETERLLIRDNIPEDIEDHHRLLSDSEVMSYLDDLLTNTYEESKINLDFSIEQATRKVGREHYFFAILDKNKGDYIGMIGLSILRENFAGGNAQLGYFILKEYWSKGYVTEAAKSVVEYGFTNLKLHKITTGCTEENKGSEKIMKKLGMVKEAHLKKHVLHDNKWKDRVEYAKFR